MNPTRVSPPNKWKPGQSGNPNGRPPGTSAITKMREAIAADVPEILAGLAKAAKGGDVQAARLILERVLPPVKASEQPVQLPFPSDGTLTSKATAVMSAAVDGVLSPSQASQLISALGTLAKISEVDELAIRIKKLEDGHAKY